MVKLKKKLIVIPLSLLLAGYIASDYLKASETPHTAVVLQQPSKTPDFRTMTNVQEKKQAFFNFIYPSIAAKNIAITQERGELKEYIAEWQQTSPVPLIELKGSEKAFIEKLSKRYRSPIPKGGVTTAWLNSLLSRVDIIPVELAMSQAAIESAWGTSRFAVDANNYFGQWCFVEGCGLVPLHPDPEHFHAVKKFDSMSESVYAYMDNLNSHQAYHQLHEIRAKLRASNEPITAHQLANGLVNYSQIGEKYVEELQSMLRHNESFMKKAENVKIQ
ncbi:glucosaminidase domain-containing protein [Vibrio sp. SS-MA-C1-2]|uniref:glucosaminidase domain-containing protein n=1 Tax=Vibrio sp. SS-MA-C1-2 TaxID=2908646 RepID=UPI001F3E7EC8|nr:glucosaminidase domain-containing protein [Vibrio sp. SS-MA-C1-2]UJF16959.1 glucosaminidase domain-containing protein [Vibrio sp. SS-MA-C1-2]